MICFPHCKINIGLHVLSRRADGFHNIETVFYPLPLNDVLEIIPATGNDGPVFETAGIDIPGNPGINLCLKAYWLLKEKFDLPPVKMFLLKNIPVGAGLGGGSSDAAYTLKLLNDLFNLDLQKEVLSEYALNLGSDCPFFLTNQVAVAGGRGEIIKPCSLDLSGMGIVLVKPAVHISTREAYSLVTPAERNTPLNHIVSQPVENWKVLLENDFEKEISLRFPVISEIRNELYAAGAVYASLTGSGSAVYGLFYSDPEIPSGLKKFFTWKSIL